MTGAPEPVAPVDSIDPISSIGSIDFINGADVVCVVDVVEGGDAVELRSWLAKVMEDSKNLVPRVEIADLRWQ